MLHTTMQKREVRLPSKYKYPVSIKRLAVLEIVYRFCPGTCL